MSDAERARRRRARFRSILTLVGLTLSLPAGAASPGGYWLSLEARGTPGARVQAASELAGDEQRVFADDLAVTLAGEPVARVDDVQSALRWVAHWAFDGSFIGWPENPGQLRTAPAPEPSGTLARRFELQLQALVLTGATDSGSERAIHWPTDQRELLPPDLPWIPAALVPDYAPIFAAPAPRLPPAAERSGELERAGGLYLLGMLDRCEGAGPDRRCLRWAQVVARKGNRFIPGYLPAFQVAAVDAWTRGDTDLPRAVLLPYGWTPSEASFLLVARTLDNRLHQQRIDLPATPEGFPDAQLRIVETRAEIRTGSRTPLIVELSPKMDYPSSDPFESGSADSADSAGSASSASDAD